MKVSPYHTHARTKSTWMSPLAYGILKQLPDTFQGSNTTPYSLPFVAVAEAMHSLEEAESNNQALKMEIVKQLFRDCIDMGMKKSPDTTISRENVKLEIYILLKFLMPSEDHECVYGIKTIRLVRLIAQVLKQKLGRSDDASVVMRWLKSPNPQRSAMLKHGQAIISSPEMIIATVMTSKPISRSKITNLTIQDVAVLCSNLTKAYLTQEVSGTPNLDTVQTEILYEAAPHFSFVEWILFQRILLKKVSVGVGPVTVLSCIPHIEATELFKKQHDLANLAIKTTMHISDDTALWKQQPTPLTCGIPFVPMTCEVLKSPYLFKWIFSREETLSKPISPKDGRLVISSSNGGWYIPMIRNAQQKTYVSIEEENVMSNKSRAKHIKILREFKKKRMLNEEACHGFVIHYTLSIERDNTIVMLVRLVSNALVDGIMLYDNTSIDPVEEGLYEDEEASEKILTDLSKEETLEKIVKLITNKKTNSKNEETSGDEWKTSGKHKLVVMSGFKRKEPKKKKVISLKTEVTPVLEKQENKLRRSPRLLAEKLKISKTVISKSSMQNVVSNVLATKKNQILNEENEEKVMVQQKYDGDRLQVHVNRIVQNESVKKEDVPVRQLDVKLFTKWGKDVSELYSNVRDEIQNNSKLISYAPCIFDGELILTDSKNKPLSWSSEKWRYNVHDKDVSTSLKDCMTASKGNTDIVEIIHDPPIQGTMKEDDEMIMQSTINNEEDDSSESIVFAPINGLQRWSGLGPYDKQYTKGRIISDSNIKLQYIIYDILMHIGSYVHERPCKERYEILMSTYANKVFASNNHVQIIPQTLFINKTSDLINRLKESIDNHEEGLVLKDPNCEYIFGRSKNMQKLKIAGPDINACVIGVGFSFSTNPRRWGLLSCIKSNTEFLNYCRVEVFEGDSTWKAFEHVIYLKSCFRVSELIMKSNATGTSSSLNEIELNDFRVFTEYHDEKTSKPYFIIKWIAKIAKYNDLNCVLVISKLSLIDIQWLVNPLECKFSLSIRGDYKGLYKDKDFKDKPIFYPRNPIARFEFKQFQYSECDSVLDVCDKYSTSVFHAEDIINDHLLNTVLRLRRQNPKNDINLQLLRRILLGFKQYSTCCSKAWREGLPQAKEQLWPATGPLTSFSIQDYVTILQEFEKNQFLLSSSFSKKIQDAIKPKNDKAFRSLSKEEKLVLLKIPSNSMWTTLNSEHENSSESSAVKMESYENAMQMSETESQVQQLTERLKVLKKIPKPLLIPSCHSKLPNSTNEFVSTEQQQIYPLVTTIQVEEDEDDETDDE